ncbi:MULTISPECIES: gephyrin-like molybdotransferase Glp [unclassified Yoonia]|uniref:molybdopterin molybdotransferase MoeA n=1 Tax=unclassified Yoonia TaxID=2629118 RepID=UPI002B0003A0|nr:MULTISPECIES: gephyrin-like molybdotransferase Glp [unclassified Yoonia]
MITVEEALRALFALVTPLPSEEVPLRHAAHRVLARDVTARRDQPPFEASAMDGYAIHAADHWQGATLTVIGESAAGHGWRGTLAQGQALRIFTGAPVPDGAGQVVIQENVTRHGDRITITDAQDSGSNIRPKGGDFTQGTAITAPRRLTPTDIALLAAMNIARLPVTRKTVVAIIATGDELVQPGDSPGPDQIIASNSYGLAALVEAEGAIARLLPIARDTVASLEQTFALAQGADLIVTIGGASVGDHDLVGQVAQSLGMDRSFYKVAMRPGKPLMAGRLGKAAMIGLPGNPVSAMVCGHVFLLPVIRKMLGLGAHPAPLQTATLAHDIGANGPRAHYMRASLTAAGVTIFDRQDSSLLTVLAQANCLALRPPHDPARKAGENVQVLPL